MGKKKKRSSNLIKSSDSLTSEHSSTLLEDIMEHLLLIKESKGLVIGSNAVFRGIEKKAIDVVLLVSKNAFPALYHAVVSYCKNYDVLFFQLREADVLSLNSKIPTSATYGIKVKALNNKAQISKLLEKIDRARNSLRCQREKKENKCQTTVKSSICKDKLEESETEEKDVSAKLFHTKHIVSKSKFTETSEGFLSFDTSTLRNSNVPDFQNVDFPDYSVLHEKISMSVK